MSGGGWVKKLDLALVVDDSVVIAPFSNALPVERSVKLGESRSDINSVTTLYKSEVYV